MFAFIQLRLSGLGIVVLDPGEGTVVEKLMAARLKSVKGTVFTLAKAGSADEGALTLPFVKVTFGEYDSLTDLQFWGGMGLLSADGHVDDLLVIVHELTLVLALALTFGVVVLGLELAAVGVEESEGALESE